MPVVAHFEEFYGSALKIKRSTSERYSASFSTFQSTRMPFIKWGWKRRIFLTRKRLHKGTKTLLFLQMFFITEQMKVKWVLGWCHRPRVPFSCQLQPPLCPVLTKHTWNFAPEAVQCPSQFLGAFSSGGIGSFVAAHSRSDLPSSAIGTGLPDFWLAK